MSRSNRYKKQARIYVFGDSITRGVIFDNERQRYVRLENSVTSLIESKINGTVTNLSRFGNTVNKAKSYFEYTIDRDRPDIVVMEFGGNDCDFKWREVAAEPQGIHYPNTRYEDFEKTLIDMVNKVRKYHAEPVLATLPPLDPIRYFGWVSRFDAEAPKRILDWLGTESRMYWWQERYNTAVLSVAQMTDCPVLDLRGALLKTPDYRQHYCVDGIHPDEYGHKIMANNILKTLSLSAPQLLKA